MRLTTKYIITSDIVPSCILVRYSSIGEEVSFNCTGTTPHQHQLTWYDGFLKLATSLQLHGVIIQRVANNTLTLTIPNITPYHYGVYKCVDDDNGVILMSITLLTPQGDEAIKLLNMWDVLSWVLNMNEMSFD